jgi:hypothetical protein
VCERERESEREHENKREMLRKGERKKKERLCWLMLMLNYEKAYIANFRNCSPVEEETWIEKYL